MKHFKLMALLLVSMLSINVWALTSVAPANGKTVAIVAVTGTSPNEKYYALPQISSSASASTFNGVEISVNNSGYAVKKDGGAEVPTWTLVKNSSNANQYYISYSAGASTYYLYKNGTSSSSNYNIKVVSSSQHYWTFATSGDGYSIKSERGSAAQYLQLNSNKKFQVSGTQTLYLLELAPSFTITAQSNNTTYGTVSLSGNVITASPKAGYTYDYPAYTVTSGSAEVEQDGDKFTVKTTADCTVRINFAIKQTATIKLSEAGIITDGPSGKYSGDQYTLPTTCNQSCGDKTFVGWSTETVDSETKPTANTYHEPGEEVTLAANNTFYAVFADEGEDGGVVYQKVSSVSEGRYVLVSEKTSGTYKYMPSTESTGSNPALGSGITMTTSGGVTKLTNSVTDAMLWDLTSTGTTNEYYIRPKGSTTIGLGTTNSTGENIRISSTYKNTKWTITTSTSYNWQFKNNNTTAMYLAVYADNAWRNYSSSTTNQNGKFYLFKEESNITYSNYTTTCAAPRDIDHIEVTGTPATFWKGDEFNHTGMTVKAYYTEGDPDDVTGSATYSGYDMSVAGEQTVTVTYKSKTDTYKINVQTIANTQATAYTTAKAIEIIDAGKDLATQVYVKGTVSKVNGYYSNKYITYFLDEDAFEIYNGLGKEGAAFSSQDDIQVDDEVVVYGQLTKFGSTYELAADNQLVSLNRPKKLTSITVSGTPDYFDTQSSFNHNGMTVTAHYNTGASDDADVTASAVFTAPDMTTQGEKMVNVSYTENEIKKETSYKIQVAQYCANVVTITKGDEENGTFSLSQTGNICADGGLTISVTNIVPAEHYHFKQITATNGDVDNDAKTVSNITENTTINVEFKEDDKVTVKWHVGTAAPVETADVYVGTAFADVKANAPTVADNAAGDCANKFMGWATSAITAQDGVDEDDVAWATEPISNENKDFYAVWAKVTGSTSSDPAVTFDFTDSGWGFPLENTTTEKTYSNNGYSVTINAAAGHKTAVQQQSGGVYEQFAILFGKNGATMKLPDFGFPVSKIVCVKSPIGGTSVHFNVYSGSTAVSTEVIGCKNDDQTFIISESYQSSPLTIKVLSDHNLQIAGLKIYAGASYSNYITSCFIPTYSVTIQSNNNTMGTAAINPEHIKDAYEQGDVLEVNATVTESELYRFVNWTIEPATTGASLYMGANEAENLLIVGTGDITLTANFEEIPADPITVTLEVGEYGTLYCDDCVNNTITEKTAGDGVLVPDVTASEGWAFLGWSTSSTATEAQYKPADADIFYPSDDNKTLYAVYAQLYKVTLKYTDEVKWQTTAGGAIALPTDRNCKNETYKDHFAGWSTTEFADETTNPTETPTIYAESITPTADITLYPVFSVTAETTQWKKVAASAISETGVYALLGDDDYPFSGKISSGKGQKTDNAFEFVNGIATSAPQGTCELTMTVNSGKWSMYNADKGYLYPTDNTSGHLAWSTDATVYDQWTYYSTQTTWEYKLGSSKYAHLRCYNGQFNTYNSNGYGTLISFAKKETTSVGKYWSKPANDVTNPELDLAAGNYLAPQTIKITAATYQSDYAYRYTTDGSAPSKSSTVYDHNTGIQLEIANNYTVKVIGYDEDGYETQIASATYVLYPVFNSISDMYAGATNDKPVGLVLTNAYVHAVNTVNTNSQIFVQQGNLGVVLSVPAANVPVGVEAGKQISGTATGTYKITNGRPQISSFAFQSTFSVGEGTRPEPIPITQTTVDLVNTNLLGLVKLEGVYAQSDANNIIVVNSNNEGTGTASNVYDFFNKVSTIPASDIKCNVIGLFNERKGDKDPEIVYSIMPVLVTDFDVVEKQNATLPTVSPLGSTVEAEPTKVASGETVTITPAAGFTTSYTVNGGEKQTITTQSVPVTITESNTTIVVEATRPYYNNASATYYYEIDPGLTKYHITLPSVQTYYKIVSDVTDQKAGETVTLTISNITEHWNITGVTVEKADDEGTTVEVANPETNKYTFVMPAYAVNVKVSYKSDPTYSIDYLRGITGSTGDDITESKQYAGTELTLKECTWKAAGYTFKNWYAYYLDDESKEEVAITITDNKIIVPAHDVKIKAMWDEAAWHKDGTWELVTNVDQIEAGNFYVIAENTNNMTATNSISTGTNKYIEAVVSEFNEDKTKIVAFGDNTARWELGGESGAWTLINAETGKYLTIVTQTGSSINPVYADEDNTKWSIEINSDNEALAKYGTYNPIRFNTDGNRFKPYANKSTNIPNVQLYRFYPKAWIVTFDDNVEDEEIAVPKMQRADPTTNKVTISTMVPERTGYEFSKWNSAQGGTGLTSADPGQEIELSKNTTLYAQWNIKQYNVAVAEVENVTINAKPYGEADITEGTNADVNFKKSVVLTYSKLNEDYVFKSWKVTKADEPSVEVPISVGSSTTFEVPAYAVTVSAVIESKATTQLTVTYHANGGVNKTPEGPEEVSEQVNWNTTIKFSEHPCPFEKSLCTFVGWNTKADGSGTTYKTQVTVKTDIDLYAMWEASAVEYVLDENETTTKVKVQEGVAPKGSTAAYTQDNSTLGQMTANNPKGTLTLTGFAGKVITGVKMQMHSNKKGGAGTIVVKVGDKEICSTNYKESFGDYDNTTDWRIADLANFKAAIVGETENITIVVAASENSLYLNGYTIEYEDAEATVIRDNLTIGQYTTYCEPYAVAAGSYSGATFWNITEKTYMSDGVRLASITIEQHTGNLEAGVPYIMLPEATQLTGVQYGEAVVNPVEVGNNGLYGTFVDYAFDENEAEARDAQQLYVISNGTLYLCGTGCGVYAYRAYIKSDKINYMAPSGAPRRTIGRPNDTPTTLNGLFDNQAGKAQKALIDGHIYILRDNKMYNAQGLFVK